MKLFVECSECKGGDLAAGQSIEDLWNCGSCRGETIIEVTPALCASDPEVRRVVLEAAAEIMERLSNEHDKADRMDRASSSYLAFEALDAEAKGPT